ncbi:MAG: ABC transporter ATP-binding protein, partial [Candidatus Marinimicrobia bacterium]|nr:ABC transporter ATP-binding protein [Candidatus Neomarinimicrobiota bacterium]MBT6417421.1 ABC transporter ATP-binding protein [Candidatus Neomarinimicrobiota bacterium]MBT7495960.1 ABC transporter ATP-binding protein [Candidatus Neomarinimicrobiota bacterium]
MTPAISIRNLKKSYEDTVALKGIDLTIGDGEFFGLLGPNGAGKTTTINILTGLVRKNEGNSEIFGKDTVKDYRFTRSQVGISAQEFTQDWFFPLDKLLYFQAGYYGIPKEKAKKRVNELISRLGLEEKREARLRQLSGGMKRR